MNWLSFDLAMIYQEEVGDRKLVAVVKYLEAVEVMAMHLLMELQLGILMVN